MSQQKKIVTEQDKQLYGDENKKIEQLKYGKKGVIIDNEEEPGPSEKEEKPFTPVRGDRRDMIDTEPSR